MRRSRSGSCLRCRGYYLCFRKHTRAMATTSLAAKTIYLEEAITYWHILCPIMALPPLSLIRATFPTLRKRFRRTPKPYLSKHSETRFQYYRHRSGIRNCSPSQNSINYRQYIRHSLLNPPHRTRSRHCSALRNQIHWWSWQFLGRSNR